jgi:hypothetical protein
MQHFQAPTSTTHRTGGRDARVVDRVPRVAVAEVVLNSAQVGPLVGEVVAAAVAQRMRVHARQARVPRGCGGQVVYRLADERLPALGDEQPRQLVVARSQVTMAAVSLSSATIAAILFARSYFVFTRQSIAAKSAEIIVFGARQA